MTITATGLDERGEEGGEGKGEGGGGGRATRDERIRYTEGCRHSIGWPRRDEPADQPAAA